MNRHIYKTVSYDRKIGVLRKEDYVFMRECLERYSIQISLLDIDNHDEIMMLKLLFIKLEHQIQQFR